MLQGFGTIVGGATVGKPVYVEKPMAMNHQQCMEMINGCADAGVPLFVTYYRRDLPRFLKVKALLDCRAIGDIRYMTVRYSQTCLKPEPVSGEPPDVCSRIYPAANPKHIQQPLIQTIVHELNGGPPCPSHGESGARTSWVMEQCIGDCYLGMK